MTVAAVIGLGTMGAGIAAVMARAGFRVRAFDIDDAAVARSRAALPAIAAVLDELSGVSGDEAGPPPLPGKDGPPGRQVPMPGEATNIAFCETLAAAVAGADLVLENVPEELALKRGVLAQIAAAAPPACVIASDTSGLPITALQDGVPAPERVVGMHWSNPPHIIPVVEVIAGRHTSAATVEWTAGTVRRLGLIPVRVERDVAGFVENRILYAIMREALDLVESGVVAPRDLDVCVSWGIGYKLAVVGPMALLDMAGLDVYRAVAGYLNADLCARGDVSPYAAERAEKGALGLKAGRGIFEYAPGEAESLRAERARRFVAVRRALNL